MRITATKTSTSFKWRVSRLAPSGEWREQGVYIADDEKDAIALYNAERISKNLSVTTVRKEMKAECICACELLINYGDYLHLVAESGTVRDISLAEFNASRKTKESKSDEGIDF